MGTFSQETLADMESEEMTGEEVVITGIAGLFPSSNNVAEFMDNLYNGVDMVTENFVDVDHPEIPKFAGKVSGVNKFDAQFFRVHYNQVISMEPMCRMLMEQAYCAMYDSGINPLAHKGKKIGVFMGSLYLDSSSMAMHCVERINDYYMSGSAKCMFANRISYWLDSKGQSYCMDANCSGTMLCLANAYNSIKSGICDAAVIGGSELCIHSNTFLALRRLGILCLDGKTKCFDKNGDGYVRSEAISVLFLQKAKDAKRIYAEVKFADVEYGLKPDAAFLESRKPEDICKFLDNFYSAAKVSPSKVEYVEAHGAAFPEADANELGAIGIVFANEKPVMVGCLKSNIGNTEPVSGACGIIKLCLAYHKGELPANLHYKDPIDISVIKDGTVKVLLKNTPFKKEYTAINNFSQTGINCHALLKGHFKPKDQNRYQCDIPRIVLISTREEKGMNKIFKYLKSQPLDPELVGLMHNIYQVETSGHTCRGYTILDTDSENKTISLSESSDINQGLERPLWFMYSGMGSQWAGMGTQLLRIPIFASAIETCRKALEPKGVDIVRILTDPEDTIFDLILNCFVGIAAVQIGLSDVLKQMGIVPDKIIGHSLGEMGCAYADGCFSAEDMILAAYTRGLISIETEFIRGSMAAVGLGYQQMLSLCPPEIVIACHNSPQSCTLSGPAEDMTKFIGELTAKGIFAKEVPCGNIAYHSRYVAQASTALLSTLRNINIKTVPRSEKWVCTSFPEEKWDDPIAKCSSSEYHTNNFLSSVYFEEAARHIPHNAVIIEIAPHCLFQSILKKSHPKCTYIPLTRRFHPDPVKFLLDGIGKLYQEGFSPKVGMLYPEIVFPVSTETPLLSPLVEWYHEDDWTTSYEGVKMKIVTPTRRFAMSLQNRDYKFIAGHVRDGNVVFPESAILFILWETMAMYNEVNYEKFPVIFRDVTFYGDVTVTPDETVQYIFSINKGNNYFEVMCDDFLFANGYIFEDTKPKFIPLDDQPITDKQDFIVMTSDDIYGIMRSKGHFYENEFKPISSSSTKWNSAQINWTGNWITFLDGLMQLNMLAGNSKFGTVPKFIRYLKIDTAYHTKQISHMEGNTMTAKLERNCGVTQCGGVEIRDIILENRKSFKLMPDVVEVKKFGEHQPNIQTNGNGHNGNGRNSDYALTSFTILNTKAHDIESLKLVEVDVKPQTDNTVQVYFSGVSTRDIEKILGSYEYENEGFGMYFSGITNSGGRVMGLVETGALASTVESNEDLLWPVPSYWSLKEAATVPLHYVYAYYCLVVRGNLHPGQSILITNGSDGLGHAVISICLSNRCTIYTCVDDARKKKILLKLFPTLNENNVSCSNDEGFYVDLITNNKFSNLVISSNIGQLREWAMKCVNFGGTFMDIAIHDKKNNKEFGSEFVFGCKTYMSVMLSSIFRPDNIKERKLLQSLISDGIVTGAVNPITHVMYSIDKVPRAFRMVSSYKHIGSVLINIKEFDTLNHALTTTPRLKHSEAATYVIVSDSSDIAIELGNRLVKHGARNLVINFLQKSCTAGYVKSKLWQWQKQEVEVKITTNNLQLKTNCIKFFDNLNKNDVRGIFVVNADSKLNNENNEIITLDEYYSEITSVVSNLDSVSEENCPKIKHFVIITLYRKNLPSTLEEIVRKRKGSGLPALLFCTELVTAADQDLNSEVHHMSMESVLSVLESCLKQKYNYINTFNVREVNDLEFLSKVAALIGVRNIHDFDSHLTMAELNLTITNIEELINLIQKYHNFHLSFDHIPKLTIDSLKNLNRKKSKQRTKFDSGLRAFYNIFEKNEVDAEDIIVPMPSILQSSTEEEINLDANGTYLMLIPGFEGHFHVFQTLCEKLKINSIALQHGLDAENDIRKIALALTKVIKKRFKMKSKFYILGYSFGVNIALEIAALLEKDGLVGVVYCLDSSPDALKVQLDAYLGKLTEEQLQIVLIEQLYFLICGQRDETLKQEIGAISDWSEKVDLFVKKLKLNKHVSNTFQYLQDVLEIAQRRIKLAKEYSPNYKLESELVLLKGVSHPDAVHLPNDYNLSKYTTTPVKVYNIKSDIACAPEDRTVSNILNQLLDDEHLDALKINNLCEVYLTSPFHDRKSKDI